LGCGEAGAGLARQCHRRQSRGTQLTAAGLHERSDRMSRSALYLMIGLLVAGVVVIGYLYYQESQSGIDIEIGEKGITIEGN
jgi:hypothetical protein